MVAVIILDKYSNASFCNIILIERYIPNKPRNTAVLA